MDRMTMLKILKGQGEAAGSDFNDSDEVNGWFGWTIEQDGPARVLAVTHHPDEGTETTARWQLIPMGIPPQAPREAVQPPAVEPTEGRW
jgi:hypothetical protein